MNESEERASVNTDREIWRGGDGEDYYQPSIHVTKEGGIGINVGGYVYVKPVEEWHKLAGGKFPAIAAKQSAEPNWESRAMFVARLQAKTEREELMTANEVLGLLNDCDHCVSMNRPPSPPAVEAPSLREALATLVVKLTAIEADPNYQGIWSFLLVHGIEWKGPSWHEELESAKRALASPTAGPTQTSQRAPSVALTAKQRYDELRVEEDESDPVERLRAFCSFSMNGQDWCDSEALFTAILACRGLSEARDAPDRELDAQ